jgi:hypothetical protein
MPAMVRARSGAACVGALVALSAVAACGGVSASVKASGASAAPDLSKIPGMAMGAPPQTVSMNCASESACDVVFIPPSTETATPLGLRVGLTRAEAQQVVLSVAGKQVTVAPGKVVHVGAVAISLLGSPGGAAVSLRFRKG